MASPTTDTLLGAKSSESQTFGKSSKSADETSAKSAKDGTTSPTIDTLLSSAKSSKMVKDGMASPTSNSLSSAKSSKGVASPVDSAKISKSSKA